MTAVEKLQNCGWFLTLTPRRPVDTGGATSGMLRQVKWKRESPGEILGQPTHLESISGIGVHEKATKWAVSLNSQSRSCAHPEAAYKHVP